MSRITEHNSGSGNVLGVPHSLDELWGYFNIRETQDSSYAGYADIAADAADSIEMVLRRNHTEEPISIDLALVPGHSAGIYLDEQTTASRELMELIFAINKLTPVIDESSEANPYGRTLWRSVEPDNPLKIIETRSKDTKSDLVRLTAVTDVPGDLVDHIQASPIYPEATTKAIKRSRALQKLASNALSEAREEELDYLGYIQELPVTNFESPHDLAA